MPMAEKIIRIVNYFDGLLLTKLPDPTGSRGLVRSCDKLKSLFLQYHSAFGHETSWLLAKRNFQS